MKSVCFRKIKKEKPIFRIVVERGCYALLNTDNVLIYMTRFIDELADVTAQITNMPWHIDAGDLLYVDDTIRRAFWDNYDRKCIELKEEYIKLHHQN